MKTSKYLIIAIIGMLCLTVTGCKDKKQKSRQQQIEEFRAELTGEDTLAMLKICDDAMAQLKSKDVDGVISKLYEYDDSTKEMSKLSKEMEKRLRKRFKMFPVLDYKREYFSFMLEGCNDVKYRITFATAEQAGTKEAPTTMFMFNPIRIDGEWRLCVKTQRDEIDNEKEEEYMSNYQTKP